MRIALVHEWLTEMGGSEKVVEALAGLYPGAPIFTLFHDPAIAQRPAFAWLNDHPVHASCLNRLPGAKKKLRKALLPWYPFAVEQFDLRGFDVVISSSHVAAKGVLTRADQLHVSYVHTPVRFAWDLYHEYLETSHIGWGPKGLLTRKMLHRFRQWDQLSAQRVDAFAANSHYVARRIAKLYHREAEVIHPPVEVERFSPSQPREDFYLVVSRLAPYKRIALAVAACNKLKRKLVVIGDGPLLAELRKQAGPTVTLLGEVDDATLQRHMQTCRALIHPADEDFGIVIVEAQAAGAPVIAHGGSGPAETVVDGETGVLFHEQTEPAVAAAIERLEALGPLDAAAIAAHAAGCSRACFEQKWRAFLNQCLERFGPQAGIWTRT